jgi:predicted porin
MIKTVLTLAVLATLSTASSAQSTSNVTLFGNIDAALGVSNNGARGASNVASVNSGTLSGSNWGIRGTEDLGNGLKAKFVLQAGFDVDTGAAKTYAGNPSTATPGLPGGASFSGLFNRRAFVELEGNFGSISAGRDYTPLYWVASGTDPLRLALYGNAQDITQISGTGSERFGRVSNAVFYLSPRINGFRGRLMYSLGSESPGYTGVPTPTTPAPKDANDMAGASLEYLAGGWVVSGAYQELKLPTVAGTGASAVFTGATGTRHDAIVGAKYNFGKFLLGGGYARIKQPVPNSDGSAVWLGGSVTVGSGIFLVELQRMRLAAAAGLGKEAKIFSASYVYPLSKQTSLYATSGKLNNNSTGTFALASNDNQVAAGAVGSHVKALAVGIRHTF